MYRALLADNLYGGLQIRVQQKEMTCECKKPAVNTPIVITIKKEVRIAKVILYQEWILEFCGTMLTKFSIIIIIILT